MKKQQLLETREDVQTVITMLESLAITVKFTGLCVWLQDTPTPAQIDELSGLYSDYLRYSEKKAKWYFRLTDYAPRMKGELCITATR